MTLRTCNVCKRYGCRKKDNCDNIYYEKDVKTGLRTCNVCKRYGCRKKDNCDNIYSNKDNKNININKLEIDDNDNNSEKINRDEIVNQRLQEWVIKMYSDNPYLYKIPQKIIDEKRNMIICEVYN